MLAALRKTQLIVVALAASMGACASSPESPDTQAKQIDEACRQYGEQFGLVAELRDKGVPLTHVLARTDDEVAIAGATIIYRDSRMPPYAAAWFGYGFCLAHKEQGEGA